MPNTQGCPFSARARAFGLSLINGCGATRRGLRVPAVAPQKTKFRGSNQWPAPRCSRVLSSEVVSDIRSVRTTNQKTGDRESNHEGNINDHCQHHLHECGIGTIKGRLRTNSSGNAPAFPPIHACPPRESDICIFNSHRRIRAANCNKCGARARRLCESASQSPLSGHACPAIPDVIPTPRSGFYIADPYVAAPTKVRQRCFTSAFLNLTAIGRRTSERSCPNQSP